MNTQLIMKIMDLQVTSINIIVRECARRIMDMSKEKEKLKIDRREAKKLRNKIVGAGNTMDSYGNKFNSMNSNSSYKPQEKPQNVSIYFNI